VLAVAGFHKERFGCGQGLGNFMAYGDLPAGSIGDPSRFSFPRGVLLGRDLPTVHPLDPGKLAECLSHSGYDYSVGDQTSLQLLLLFSGRPRRGSTPHPAPAHLGASRL
jgi:hydrogenase large subunit